MPLKDAVATILNRNAFYRDGYRMLLRISIVQGIVILALLISIIGLVTSIQERYIYFATTADGVIINLVPLNEPYRTNGEVVTWASNVAKNVMRFDYDDYRERLTQASSNFTPRGWDSFSKALKDAQFIDAITTRKQVLSLDINSAPEIQSAGVRDGFYTWDLKFPVTIRFDGAQASEPIPSILFMRVERVSTLQNPEGISIEQWVLVKVGSK
jgi:intracellular multiplication protein IcmL